MRRTSAHSATLFLRRTYPYISIASDDSTFRYAFSPTHLPLYLYCVGRQHIPLRFFSDTFTHISLLRRTIVFPPSFFPDTFTHISLLRRTSAHSATLFLRRTNPYISIASDVSTFRYAFSPTHSPTYLSCVGQSHISPSFFSDAFTHISLLRRTITHFAKLFSRRTHPYTTSASDDSPFRYAFSPTHLPIYLFRVGRQALPSTFRFPVST